MSKIQEMSIDEILKKIGANLADVDFNIVFQNNEDVLNRLTRYMKRINNIEGLSGNDRIAKIEDFFRENEHFVDKESMVVLTIFNTQMTIDRKPEDKKLEKELRRYISNGIRMLDGENITVYKLSKKSKSGNYNRLDEINSEKLLECIQSKIPVSTLVEPSSSQRKRMEMIDEYVGDLDTVVMELRDSDIVSIIAKSERFGKRMLQLITFNVIALFEDMHPKSNLRKIIQENGCVPKEIDESEDAGFCQRKCRALGLIENCKNIDMDKLLLIIGYRMIEDLENGTTEVRSDTGEDLLTKESEYCIELFRSIISNITEMCNKDTIVYGIEAVNGERVDYSAKDLADDFLRFKNGRYISKKECDELTGKISTGEISLQDVPDEMIILLATEQEQYESFMANSTENLIYTINNKFKSKDEIYGIIAKMNRISNEVLDAMVSTEILSFDEAVLFYEQGKISLEQMKSLDIGKEQREDLVSGKVEELYRKSLELENDENRQNEYIEAFGLFSKYVGLYRAYNFEGKSDEEINQRSSDLIEKFEDILSDKTLQDLYQYGLISLGTAISWGGNLLDMLSKNNIKATDLKNLYANGTISIEQIKEVLRYKDIPNDEKLDLIYGTFDGESKEEADIRNELIQLLSGVEEYRDTYNRTGNKRAKGEGTKKRELVTDPQARWKFISLIDKDYSKRFLPEDKGVYDGHRVFFFPNKNSIFIEKMYERRKGRIVSAYAKATYIMDANVFFENVDDIIIQGAINRKFLVGMSDAIRIDHNSAWARKIMEYYNISIENREYTKEHIMKFKKAEERIKRSREERE